MSSTPAEEFDLPLLITPAEITARTGAQGVGNHEILLAQEMIGAATGVDLTLDPLPYLLRDVRHLRAAVLWQAIHLAAHPELTTIDSNLTAASANGVSVTYGPGGSAEATISTFAAKALARLSWRGTRSVPLRRPFARTRRAQTLANDGADTDWRPLS